MDPARPGIDNAHPTTPFLARLRMRAVDHTLLANPPVAAIFCLFRWLHLIAPEPYWLYVAVVVGGGAASVISSALWAPPGRPWHRSAHTAANMAVIAVVAYSTGWGPILSIGFLFGAAGAIEQFGSTVTRACLIWTTAAVVLGQVAIALRASPTLIHRPLVYGVAALGLIGALLVIELLGRSSAARESVEVELRQSERRFKALVSNAADIIVVTDEAGMLQYVSPAFERSLGRYAESHQGEPLGSFVHPDDLARISAEFPPLLEDPSRVLRTVLRALDTQSRWRHFEVTVTNHLDDPDVRGIVANLHDITELREAHERFRSAFEHAPIGMGMSDLEGTIIQTNAAYGEILGRRPEDLAGMTISDITHPDDREWSSAELPGFHLRGCPHVPGREALCTGRRHCGMGVGEHLVRTGRRAAAVVPDCPSRGHHRAPRVTRAVGVRGDP